MQNFLMKRLRAFTLVELVMVIIIIGILAAIVIPNFSLQREQAAIATTKANLEALRTAIALYYANEGTYIMIDNPSALCGIYDCMATTGRKYINEIPLETITTPPATMVSTTLSGIGGWYWRTSDYTIYPNNPNNMPTDANGDVYTEY